MERERNGQGALRVLIVDSERAMRESLRHALVALGFECATAESTETALRLLAQEAFEIVLLDLRSGAEGIEPLAQIKSQFPQVLVLATSAYASVQAAVQVMKHGAFDLLSKPFQLDDLRAALERASHAVTLAEEYRLPRETMNEHHGFGDLIGQSPAMQKVYRIIAKVAKSTHPVMINGESGTGKELVARQIHFSGPQRDKPFIPVDCGSLVPTLIESELFGYVRGAFTGAVRPKQGLLQIADGGTVFLDEIAELPTDLQAKLLRALQEKEVRPVGSTRTVPLNVRILAATNRDLEQAVEQGSFRKDLYFRLNVVRLRIPPLRERREDIPVLVAHFLMRINHSSGVERTFAPDAMEAILQYEWPGNVRELENMVERACALTSGPLIQVCDLPTPLHGMLRRAASDEGRSGRVVPIAEMEKQAIIHALESVKGDKLKAAKLLGIGKTTLYRKLKEYRQQR